MARYDIEADWQLLNTCNYRCSYCFFGPETLGSKLTSYADADTWSSSFDRTGMTWLLHLTGGEPGIYPKFVELCSSLTKRHFISLNTNLTHSSFIRFAERIDASRVSFINAGLHLQERGKRGEIGTFVDHAAVLQDNGFPLFISLVATPGALRRFGEAVERLRPAKQFPIPKLFRGTLDAKIYPEAYSESERALFRDYANQARNFYHDRTSGFGEPPSIDMLNDDRYLGGVPMYKGRLCSAGSRFVQIYPNGDVFRCGGLGLQGNLLAGTAVFRSGAEACSSQHCYYFCDKYSKM
jgi:MoaA/NifB/PqqE/SkfB family radical SAM enzyme